MNAAMSALTDSIGFGLAATGCAGLLVIAAELRLRGFVLEAVSRRRWKKCHTCPEIHNGFHRCPNRLFGFCMDCGRKRFLDRYGNCPSGHTMIQGRTFRRKRLNG